MSRSGSPVPSSSTQVFVPRSVRNFPGGWASCGALAESAPAMDIHRNVPVITMKRNTDITSSSFSILRGRGFQVSFPSGLQVATVHEKNRAGHVSVFEQEKHGVRNLFGSADAAEWKLLGGFVEHG